MNAFFAPLKELGEFLEIKRALKDRRGMLQVTGCIDSQKSHFMAALGEGCASKLIVAANDLRAREIYDNYRLFDKDVMLCPARDYIFFQADVSSKQLARDRIRILRPLAEGNGVTVITTIADLMSRRMPFGQWKENIRTIRTGDEIDLAEAGRTLVRLGYERNVQAEGPGQFAVRGNILDIYPLTEDLPVRIELWGDEVDSIRCFDPETQRSVEERDSADIYPASEMVLDADRAREGFAVIEKQAKRAEETFRKHMKTEEAHRIRMTLQESRDRHGGLCGLLL